jgi:hypothetical protein
MGCGWSARLSDLRFVVNFPRTLSVYISHSNSRLVFQGHGILFWYMDRTDRKGFFFHGDDNRMDGFEFSVWGCEEEEGDMERRGG